MTELPSVDAARRLILEAVAPLGPPEAVSVDDVLGRVLAEPVRAAGDVPSFANSAMDGIAARAGGAGRRLRVVDESRAGHPARREVGEGEAVRISTGASLPGGADGVCRIEDVEDHGDEVVLRAAVEPGRHVRGPGEDLRAGALVLDRGTPVGPAELGAAISAGRGEVLCAPRPRVAVLSTGDELVAPGGPLGPGQIHNSNSLTAAALATRAGASVVRHGEVPDDPAATADALGAALRDADVLVVSGGVSVGPHDHVKGALDALGVQERLWRVALQPGKPTWFGVHGERLVFGLPGNPVSAMVCFSLFVLPALRALQGAPALPGPRRARLSVGVRRSPEREQAIRVRLRWSEGAVVAEPTGAQGSHILSSMLGADALARVPRGEGELAAGELVDVEALG